jgi:hypothetical protein
LKVVLQSVRVLVFRCEVLEDGLPGDHSRLTGGEAAVEDEQGEVPAAGGLVEGTGDFEGDGYWVLAQVLVEAGVEQEAVAVVGQDLAVGRL